jgi:predicted nucleic acid-binding protein
MIIVDASVALKWFVEEPLYSCARHILEYQLDMQAPDYILIEVANAARKKATRGEIVNDHARQIVKLVTEAIPTLIPASKILGQAMEMALALDHPIYDCLYLACLTDRHDGLVTADKKFFNKVKQTDRADQIHFLDDPELALPLYLAIHKADELIKLSELLEQTHDNLRDLLTGKQEFQFVEITALQPLFDSPAAHRLHSVIQSFNHEELADVLALGWLGRGYDGTDWAKIRQQAKAAIKAHDSDYLRYVESITIYLRQGLDILRSLQ